MPPIESRRRGTTEEEERKEEEARREKKLGDDACGAMRYKPAVEHYTRGADLDPADISLWIKRAKAYFRMNQYEECVIDCDEAVKRSGGGGGGDKLAAKALSWKGLALLNLAACAADCEPAILALRQSLGKHYREETHAVLDEAERAMESFQEQEAADRHQHKDEHMREQVLRIYKLLIRRIYMKTNLICTNPLRCRNAVAECLHGLRIAGGELLRQQKYEEAVMQFTEAIKRNPRNPKNFSDRAQCHIKQGELPKALEDADRCIELDSTFGMGYVCKGMAQLRMGKYEDAQATYVGGLKHDPRNLQILDGLERCAVFFKAANGSNSRAKDSRQHERDIEHLRDELQKSKEKASRERSRRMEYEELARALEESYSGLVEQLTTKHDVVTVELQLAREHKEDLEHQLSECRECLERLLSTQSRVPPHFICPISHEVMNDPHIAADGYTYEAEEIRHWFQRGRHTSPMTNLRLEHEQLIPNRALRSAIQEWRQQQNMAL
uniref:RING-type E3 ubiquitin transferase n=1 Tax=Oryza brachyantha TaxID=4533 RepID=A0A1V1H194_ORYBR|nr:stress-induced protein sti1-like protein (ISS) -like [Oryza brachyantha]